MNTAFYQESYCYASDVNNQDSINDVISCIGEPNVTPLMTYLNESPMFAEVSADDSNTPSIRNSRQLNSTLKWLESNFQFRSSVSISRSTIYELYQRFCQQYQFVPVCKATFGKVCTTNRFCSSLSVACVA